MKENYCQHESTDREFKSFQAWKGRLIYIIEDFLKLTENSKKIRSGDILILESLKTSIINEKLKIAFVGEFSRGKSEIINAILFSNGKGRILKSSVGQTTMCPLEINSSNNSTDEYLEVLPIETKKSDILLKTLMNKKNFWYRQKVSLKNIANEDPLEIIYNKNCVSIEEARKMGLCKPFNSLSREQQKTVCQSCGLGKVLIPRWRYGNLFIDNTILNYGLTIIDTPGLNSLGAEPELTLEILKNVDLIIFVLGIDTGVTQSDLELWENYILPLNNKYKLVALNKIDTIFNSVENGDAEYIKNEISSQIKNTSINLEISSDDIVAISGKLGFYSKKTNNIKKLKESNIEALENKIYKKIFFIKKNKIINNIMKNFLPLIENEKNNIKELIFQNELNYEKMIKIKNDSLKLLPSLIQKHRIKVDKLQNDQEYLNHKLKLLKQESHNLILKPLDLNIIQDIIDNSKKEILDAWTTSTMIRRFNIFFERSLNIFDSSLSGADRFNLIIESEYNKLMENYKLKKINNTMYQVMPKRSELIELMNYYERFGAKLEIAANTQNKVVKNTFLIVAFKIKELIEETKNEIEIILDDLFESIEERIQESKIYVKKELESLESISKSSKIIDIKIAENRKEKECLLKSESNITKIINDLMEIFAE